MQAMDKSQAYIVLEEVTQYLAAYTFFMDAGSLLGIHRNGDFIDHDTDIDFAIVMNPNDRMIFPTPDWKLIAVWNYRNLPMQRAYEYKGVIIDFYFYYSNLEEGLIVNHNDHGVLKLKVEDALPTSTIEFMGHPIRMPNSPENVILSEYGKNWKTPLTSKGDWGKDRFNLFSEFPHWPVSLEGHSPNETLTEKIALHEAQIEELTSDNQMLTLQIEAVVNSRIWRFTKLYRKLRSRKP